MLCKLSISATIEFTTATASVTEGNTVTLTLRNTGAGDGQVGESSTRNYFIVYI